MKWFNLLKGMLPVVLSFIPNLPPMLIPIIIQAIEEAEQLPGARGSEKKAHAVALVRLAIETTNAAANRIVINEEKVMPVVERAIDTGIAILNLVSKH